MTNFCKISALAAAMFCAVSAQAADVKVYGVIDTGMHYTWDNQADKHAFSMDSGITKGSRVGLSGSEKIGDHLRAFFNLETGFYADSGEFDNTKNRLFNRNSFVGLGTDYGDVSFGRMGALGSGVNGSVFLNSFTPFGNTWKECQALQIINHQVMRADNMIRYESPEMSGVKLYAQYSNGVDGDDTVAASKRDRFGAVGATYRNGPLRLVFVADNYFYKNNGRHYDRDDSQTYNLGVRYALGGVTLYGAYQYGNNVEKVGNQMTRFSKNDSATYYYSNDGLDSHAVVLGAAVKTLGGTLKLQTGYARGTQDTMKESVRRGTQTAGDVKAHVWQFAAGFEYPLSKRTNLYAGASWIDRVYKEDGEKTYGAKKSGTVRGVMAGISHTF